MSPKLRWLLAVFGAALLVDQGLKLWTVRALRYRGPALDDAARDGLAALGHSAQSPAEQVLIPGLLSLVHAQNPAAAMGMMLGYEHRMVVFGVFTVVAIAVLGLMFRALEPEDRFGAGVLGLILSGAVGNAIDRAHKGTVTDMVKMFWDFEPGKTWLLQTFGTNQWFTYNVADAALLVGVALYGIHGLFQRDGEPTEETGPNPLESAP
ncbi:MAG: signal peptidase II [Myxococcota bacterium]